ncbi:MAG: PIN domain-containing protein [Bacteroidota bacterium]
MISIVSLGELKAIAKRNKWGKRRIDYLEDMLDDFLIADINVDMIVEKYAEIDAFSQGKLTNLSLNTSARNMGKNDLWIAATASVLDIELITTDKDFDHLKDNFIRLRQIDLSLFS